MHQHPKINRYVVLAGFILMLVGLVFYFADTSNREKRFEWLVILLTGVGASVLATGITNHIVSSQLLPLPLRSVFEALSERTKLIRKHHVLTLEFNLEADVVHLTRQHEFQLFNPGSAFTKEVCLYTDTVSWRHETRGGFTRVQEPSGNQLTGSALASLLNHSSNGKVYFRKLYRLPAHDGLQFVFFSEEYYRKADRLIWTVEDLAEDFKVYIHNRTTIHDGFALKINHHRESEVMKRKIEHRHSPHHQEICFAFDTEILPYQGFEIMWDLDPLDDERSQQPNVV